MPRQTIPAESFAQTLAVNVDNADLSDADFRQLVRNTIGSVQFERTDRIKAILAEQAPR